MSRGFAPFPSSERGFSLIVSLMMLIVIIVLGLGASQMAVNEERGSRNNRDRQIAFQAAEAALKDAEVEILDPTQPACGATAPANRGRGRAGTFTCFNAINQFGFAGTATTPCSMVPNEGLCPYDPTLPAWRRGPNDPAPAVYVDFVNDAKCVGSASSVQIGRFTGRRYAAQNNCAGSSNIIVPGAAPTSAPISVYPPRYIIEIVPRNTSVDTLTSADADAAASSAAHMFRVTAIGFGANANTQVVLQTVVSTPD